MLRSGGGSGWFVPRSRFIAFCQDSSVRRLPDPGFAQADVEPGTLGETRAVATAAG
jgi:hypothetical protein